MKKSSNTMPILVPSVSLENDEVVEVISRLTGTRVLLAEHGSYDAAAGTRAVPPSPKEKAKPVRHQKLRFKG